jgi:drug/metabolite transporter (DMT)-like permease
MPIFAIALLFVSAFLHTAWNLLLKQTREKYIATWWAVLIGSLLFLPALFFTGLPAREIWGFLLISVIAEIAYYVLLSMAYNDSDFSLVYPMARGAAPALIATWSVLFLRETLTIGGMIGLAVIIVGLLIIGGSNLFNQHGKPHLRGILIALTLAVIISIYSTIDGAAVKHTAALPYAIVIFLLAPVGMTPLVLKKYGWSMLKTELGLDRWRIVAIGVLTVSAYLLSLAAYAMAPVSYTGAVREISVVIGAFAGWKLLGEKLGLARVIGAAIIFAGILIIALHG